MWSRSKSCDLLQLEYSFFIFCKFDMFSLFFLQVSTLILHSTWEIAAFVSGTRKFIKICFKCNEFNTCLIWCCDCLLISVRQLQFQQFFSKSVHDENTCEVCLFGIRILQIRWRYEMHFIHKIYYREPSLLKIRILLFYHTNIIIYICCF